MITARRQLPAFVAPVLIGLLLGSGARADDDGFEEKYQDGNCQVERKLEKGGKYKEVRECKGVPGQAHGNGPREFDQEYREGNCKVKRKLESDRDYKEERECEGAGRSRRGGYVVGAAPVPAAVYPPWVIVGEGGPAYPPGRQPQQRRRDALQCNSETVGRVGGIAGAAIGNRVGQGNGRTVATVGGAVIGVLIGGEIGRRIDAANQACIGQALEFAADGQRVEWQAQDATRYAVSPGSVLTRGGRQCRPYVAEVWTDAGWQTKRATACRHADGSWAPA